MAGDRRPLVDRPLTMPAGHATTSPLRIVSLLPGATEMLAALGLTEQLVAVSHECDEPADVRHLPRITSTPIDPSASSAEIDAAVQLAMAEGRQVIGIDASLLAELRPDVVVTQMLCDVCAFADGEAVRLAQAINPEPTVVSLDGRTLEGVWQDIERLGRAVGRAAAGEQLAASLRREVAELARVAASPRPHRVVAIEWLEPLFLAGHWVPDMIAAAGGVDVGATAGGHSTIRDWDEIFALDPDLVLVVLCGFDEERARAELAALDGQAAEWLATRRVAVLDGNAFTSRPGPRLVEGIRRMALALT